MTLDIQSFFYELVRAGCWAEFSLYVQVLFKSMFSKISLLTSSYYKQIFVRGMSCLYMLKSTTKSKCVYLKYFRKMLPVCWPSVVHFIPQGVLK